MHIFVTGSSGFLGRHLCLYLVEQGHSLVALTSKECDLTKQGTLEKLARSQYDQIYHLAAWTQAGDFCMRHGGEQWIVNQQINTNVLAWWQKFQPQAKLITLGTSVSYSTEDNLSEEEYMVGIPKERFFAYAMSKRMLYAGLVSLNKQFGLKYLYLVPSTLYGPRYHTDGRQMHFIFDLIRKILRAKLYGEPVVLWGDGYQRRELVFIDDFVRIMLQMADICNNELINIGSGEEFTIRYFAELICKKLKYDPNNIQYDTSRYVGAKSKCLVVNKLHRLLLDIPMTPLEKGLSATIDWFWSEKEKLLADTK
jgi:GDP-L-fucose synthase